MKENILITGNPGIGKTTVIKKLVFVLQNRNQPVSGFYTKEIRKYGKHGRRTGFEIICLDGTRGILASTEQEFDMKFGRYSVNLEDIRELMVTRMKSPDGVFILDEIGKMELLEPTFRKSLFDLLDRGNLIATITIKDTPLTSRMKTHLTTTLLEMTMENRDSMSEIIVRMLDKWNE
ncbi:MAG: nucleoside-triphosphatase [Candidatus Hodarchaeales archaeon]